MAKYKYAYEHIWDNRNALKENNRRMPPYCIELITELNEENNRLYEENEKLKEKLWKINGISTLSVLDELHKGEEK